MAIPLLNGYSMTEIENELRISPSLVSTLLDELRDELAAGAIGERSGNKPP